MHETLCEIFADCKPFPLCESPQASLAGHAIKIGGMAHEPTDRERRDAVAARLRSAREAAGYSNAALCRLLGITATRLTSWEKGRALPNSARLWHDLCEALDVTCDFILRGSTAGLNRTTYVKLMEPTGEKPPGMDAL